MQRDLARFYDAPVSLEYAREYQIKNNVRDDELTPKDYYYLLLGQYDQTSKLIDSSANRGLVIADTNSLVTKGYYDYYMEVEGQDTSMTDTFDNLFVSILSKEKWDLILFVQPIGSYVNDGFRDMTMADEEIRTRFSNYLDQLRQQYLGNIPTTFLASDYLGNYEEAKEGDRCHLPSRLRSSLWKTYLKNSQLLAKTLEMFSKKRKARLCQYYETPVEGPFVGRTAFQWIYLLLLSSVPFFLEWTNRTGQHDWLGLFASWTGIVCVILVAEGRASNYLFGAVNSAIYLILALNKTFYGEVLTTLYFFIMQPIGLYVWL